MWRCSRCGVTVTQPEIKNATERCSNCGAARAPAGKWGTDLSKPLEGGFRVGFEVFRGTWGTWENLFEQAAEFAGRVGPERLIAISHSEDGNDGVVTVWYWIEG
jgi:hypothetical protein